MSPRGRRTVLRSLAVAALPAVGGCASSGGGEQPGGETSTTPCRADPPLAPPDGRDYPTVPGDLDREAATTFAEAYERAYQAAREPNYRSIRYERAPAVRERPGGYDVWLAVWLRTGPTGDGTPTVPMGDAFYTAPYAIRNDTVRRARGPSEAELLDSVDPADGRVLICR